MWMLFHSFPSHLWTDVQQKTPDKWIGTKDPDAWPPKYPGLTPLDNFLGLRKLYNIYHNKRNKVQWMHSSQ